MNKKTKEKLLQLTRFYNSLDFKATVPDAELDDHQKNVDLLEELFFDAESPKTAKEIEENLYNNSSSIPRATYGEFAKLPPVILNFKAESEGHADSMKHDVIEWFQDKTDLKDIFLPQSGDYSIEVDDHVENMLFAQVRSDITSPMRRGADLLDSYMNYIPNIERSKCIPSVKVKFLSTKNIAKNQNSEQLAVFKFLNGNTPKSNADDKNEDSGSADYLLTQASKREASSAISDSVSSTVNGMEMFTMPQTLRGHVSNALSDPFRPLMSLDGVSINVYPAGEGMISFKRGTLDITLFDRSRLSDVSFLLDPSRFGFTTIEIEAGWNHPDPKNVYGAIINEMTIKDIYQIEKADFSMKGASTFNISVDIAQIGGKTLFHQDIFTQPEQVMTIREFNITSNKILSEYREITAKLRKSWTPTTHILPESIVEKKKDESSVIVLNQGSLGEVEKALAGYRVAQESGENISVGDITALGALIEGLKGEGNTITKAAEAVEALKTAFENKMADPGDSKDPFLDDKFIVELPATAGTASSTERPTAPQGTTVYDHPLDPPGIWEYKWDVGPGTNPSPPLVWYSRHRDATDEPWFNIHTLPPNHVDMPLAYERLNEWYPFAEGPSTETTDYISFGKLLLNLIALPMKANKGNKVDEVHLITYDFNKYAGALGRGNTEEITGTNIATFALKKEDIKAEMTKHLEKKYSISAKDLFSFASKIMSDKLNGQFGIVETDENGNVIGDASTLKAEIHQHEQTILEKTRKKDKLHSTPGQDTANYIDASDYDAKFGELSDAIAAAKDQLDKTMEKLNNEIKDRTSALMATMKTSKIKMPSIKMFVDSVKSRSGKNIVRLHVYDSNEKPYEVHEMAANMGTMLAGDAEFSPSSKNKQLFERLTDRGLIKKINATETMPERWVLNFRNVKLKDAIKAHMPSITYGTEATAINSISLNSISDSDINTHFLLETQKTEKDASKSGGEPLERNQELSAAEKIFPVTLTVDMLGCPVIEYGQQIYVDLGTKTDLDNVYGVMNITHNLKPGSFKSTIKLSPTFSGDSVTFSDLINDIIAENERLKLNASSEGA